MPAERPAVDGGALILAAGFSRRFGSDKRRHRLPDGRTLLIATLDRYLQVFPSVAVVIRNEDDALAAEVAAACPTVRIIRTAEAESGMGHSLAAGIRAVASNWNWAAIGLGDMPFVETGTLDLLVRALGDGDADTIVQPRIGPRAGHPVLFTARYFDELSALRGDVGARRVIDRHRNSVLEVPVDDPGVLMDLDQPPSA